MLVLSALLAPATPIQAKDVKVKGKVVTDKDTPISGVTVQAFRQGEVGAPVLSDGMGEYAVGLAPGGPITRVEYRHNSFDLAIIVFVSGQDAEQRIVKVMYPRGSRRTAGAVADTVSAYEQFGVNAFIAPPKDRPRFVALSKELDMISKLSDMPIKVDDPFISGYLEWRRKSVVELLSKL